VGAFYAPSVREGKQILPHDPATAVETIGGYTNRHVGAFYALVCPPIYSTDVNDLTCKTPLAVGAPSVTAQRMISSAWKSSIGGMVRPRAWAVFRLITSSNFIGCSTGKSAGLAPFRILST
jgi:hypothetical protein